VSGIVVKDGNSELSIYKYGFKVIVKCLELKHDGGVVNFMIDTGRETIKRQVLVLVSDRKRDIAVSPRTSSIRVKYGSTSSPPRIPTFSLTPSSTRFVRTLHIPLRIKYNCLILSSCLKFDSGTLNLTHLASWAICFTVPCDQSRKGAVRCRKTIFSLTSFSRELSIILVQGQE
jgi:hypothetical protein